MEDLNFILVNNLFIIIKSKNVIIKPLEHSYLFGKNKSQH